MYDSTIAHDSTVPSVRGEAWTLSMVVIAIAIALFL